MNKQLIKILLLLIPFVVLIPAVTDAQQVVLEKISRVGSDLPKTPFVEPVVAVNPVDPDKIIAAAISVNEPFSDDWYHSWSVRLLVSDDNGQTWERIKLPPLHNLKFSGDAWLEWSLDGTAYLSMIALISVKPDSDITKVFVYKSHDGGHSWSGPASAFPGMKAVDHPVLSVYNDGKKNSVMVFASGYTTGENFGPLSVSRSDSGAEKFNELPSYHPDSLNNNLGSGVAINDSQIVFSYYCMSKPLPGPLWAVRSEDNGMTYHKSIITSKHIPVGFPMMAIDRSSSKSHNRVYSVWTLSNEKPYIMSAHSDDYGKTWSDPVRVNSDTSIANRVMPNVVINNKGVVGISWVDGRNSKGSCWDIYFAASIDGGKTFLPEIRLTPEVSCPAFSGNGGAASRWRWGGDYMGIASDSEGAFYPIWSDSRSGTYQLWIAKILVKDAGKE